MSAQHHKRPPCLGMFIPSQQRHSALLADGGEKRKKGFAKQMKDVKEIKVRIFKLQTVLFKHAQAVLEAPI